jgi:quinolinate synthetase A subunit
LRKYFSKCNDFGLQKRVILHLNERKEFYEKNVSRLEAVRPIEDYLTMPDAEFTSALKRARGIRLARRRSRTSLPARRRNRTRRFDGRFVSAFGDGFAKRKDAEFIVFCGVHFMAESADILGQPHQKVILPDLGAGCSMADMATIEQVEDAWEQLREIGVLQEKVAPITYMNSSAAIKAFCGRNGGVVCTSSNAIPLFDVYLKEYDKMFFFPDQHLGRNTGAKFGIPLDKMVLWNPHEELGGNTEEELHAAKLILWRGHCSVHGASSRGTSTKFAKTFPTYKVLVHPECMREVVEISDLNGSTSFIINTVKTRRAARNGQSARN